MDEVFFEDQEEQENNDLGTRMKNLQKKRQLKNMVTPFWTQEEIKEELKEEKKRADSWWKVASWSKQENKKVTSWWKDPSKKKEVSFSPRSEAYASNEGPDED